MALPRQPVTSGLNIGELQDDHNDAIDTFQKEAVNGSDIDVMDFASTNVQSLKEHLSMTQELENEHTKRHKGLRSQNRKLRSPPIMNQRSRWLPEFARNHRGVVPSQKCLPRSRATAAPATKYPPQPE